MTELILVSTLVAFVLGLLGFVIKRDDRVQAKFEAILVQITDITKRVTVLQTRVDLLWDIYVKDSLRSVMEKGVIGSSEPHIREDWLKQAAEDGLMRWELVPIMERLARSNLIGPDLSHAIVEDFTIEFITRHSTELGLSVSEYISGSVVSVMQERRDPGFWRRMQSELDGVEGSV